MSFSCLSVCVFSHHVSAASNLLVLIHVFQVVLLTDKEVQVLLPVSVDCLHVSLRTVGKHILGKKEQALE